jgi:hypothetical protein
MRNTFMVSAAKCLEYMYQVECLAFPLGKSKVTMHCISACVERHVMVHIFELDAVMKKVRLD